MKQIPNRTHVRTDDPILDIITGNTEGQRAKELTASVTDIYELWALAKMAEHARREQIIDSLVSMGYTPQRIGPGKYSFCHDSYDVEYTRLKGTVFSVRLSIPRIIGADVADEGTINRAMDYVRQLANVDLYVEDGYVAVMSQIARPSDQDTESILKDNLRRLTGVAGLIRRLLSYHNNN